MEIICCECAVFWQIGHGYRGQVWSAREVMEYLNNVDIEDYRLIGQISELFSSPVIPKISVVGLSDEEVCGSEELKLFKDILSRALDNLFVIDFIEQVPIP